VTRLTAVAERGQRTREGPRSPRGRLFRKYAVVFVALVSGALVTSGAIDLYFSHRENQAALVRVQKEKALGAAARIETFITEIERQMGWTTQPQLVGARAALEQRKFDFIRLQRQVPPITELSYLDASGKEQIRVSRLAMDVIGSQADFSTDPKFREARAGKTYFGPVYFRKGSEPYMTIAMPQVGGTGVTVAEVNLKFIWDVVSKIKIGKAGRAFVVDGQGVLIAHPDISLVLQKTTLAALPHVRAALAGEGVGREEVTIARDREGRHVLTASATILPLKWTVLVEQPVEEALESLSASIKRTVGLIALGVALSVVASLILARRMVQPIRALQEGAARIGVGELGLRLKVTTGDELEALADEFNRMTAQLQESYALLEQRVEQRTRELSEALEQQTATGEILRVISSSPTNVQPVLDIVARNAARVCSATDSQILLVEGEALRLRAHYGPIRGFPVGEQFPIHRGTLMGRSILDGRTVHVHDVYADTTDLPAERAMALRFGHRTALATPLIREGLPIGVLLIRRTDVQPFTDKQIELLKTFADQAVIAIENVRLFTELEARTRALARSVGELTALGEVGRAVSSTLDLDRVLATIVARASELAGADACTIYEFDETRQEFHQRAAYGVSPDYIDAVRATPLRKGEGVMGRAAERREPMQIPDIAAEGAYDSRLRDVLVAAGYRALLSVPLVREDEIIGSLSFNRKTPGEFPPEVIEVLKTFATQSVLAIQNARLFREIEEKSQQLEVANRHKSEFLANMSHELRTPLNAIIGFSEVLVDKMFGQLNEKQEEYLRDIYSSGRHLLSLINDILDLSKIEAGRMELEITTFDLPQAIENALTLVRGRADAHAIRLEVAADQRLGDFIGDERKFKQILLNLLTNAIKFTPEGGCVGVAATIANGSIEVSVSDTGIGIAPEDQALIFDEFRQASTDHAGRREGTGLGLALTKRFVELHGGQMWVKSEVGRGSTFTFTLPVRR
jgi:signal transduction histidine kinase/HAMP domain-containing protein